MNANYFIIRTAKYNHSILSRINLSTIGLKTSDIPDFGLSATKYVILSFTGGI